MKKSIVRRFGLPLAVAAWLGAGACSSPPKPPLVLVPEVQPSPADAARPKRVLTLQAVCGSVEYRCPREFGQTVDSIVRSGLEFAGYTVVDDTALRRDTRARHEEHVENNSNESHNVRTESGRAFLPFKRQMATQGERVAHSDSTTVVLDGSDFADLSVDERHEVMVKAGADGVVSVRVVVGGQTGTWVPNQRVEVMVKLGVNHGDTMAWASRCTASSNDFSTVTGALENAARCAMRGATGQ